MAKVEYPKFIYKAGETPKIVKSKEEHDDHDGWQEEPVTEVAQDGETEAPEPAAKPKKERNKKAAKPAEEK